MKNYKSQQSYAPIIAYLWLKEKKEELFEQELLSVIIRKTRCQSMLRAIASCIDDFAGDSGNLNIEARRKGTVNKTKTKIGELSYAYAQSIDICGKTKPEKAIVDELIVEIDKVDAKNPSWESLGVFFLLGEEISPAVKRFAERIIF